MSSHETLVNTLCTPGIHLGTGYNAGDIPPESLSQTQRNIQMSTPNHVRTQHYSTHAPSPSPTPPDGNLPHTSGNGNPGGNIENEARPTSYMKDGCIVRNSGGPPDDSSYTEPGGHWDEWNSRNNGGDDGQDNRDWDGADSWGGSHATGGGADPHWPQT